MLLRCSVPVAGGGHASLASEQQYLFLSHRGSKPLLVGQYVVVIQADMGQPLVSVEVSRGRAPRQGGHGAGLRRFVAVRVGWLVVVAVQADIGQSLVDVEECLQQLCASAHVCV